MADIGWGHIDNALSSRALDLGALDLEVWGPPVTAVGRSSAGALPVDGLREATDIQEAFAAQGWSLHRGHDFSLATNFQVNETAVLIGMSFDRVDVVYSWAATCAYVSNQSYRPLLESEYAFLSALTEAAENKFPSSLVKMSRATSFSGVSEDYLPEPFVWVVPDDAVVAWDSQQRSLTVQQLDRALRTVLLGYRWRRPPEQDERNALITQSVNQLVITSEVLADLRHLNQDRFVETLGDAVLSTELTTSHPLLAGASTAASAAQPPESSPLTKDLLGGVGVAGLSKLGSSGLPSLDKGKLGGLTGGLSPKSDTVPEDDLPSSGMSIDDFSAKMRETGTLEEASAMITRAMSNCGIADTNMQAPSANAATWVGAKGNCFVLAFLELENHHLTVTVMAADRVPLTEEFLTWLVQRPTPPVCRFKVNQNEENGRALLSVQCVGLLTSRLSEERITDLMQDVYETGSSTADLIVRRFGGSFPIGSDQSS